MKDTVTQFQTWEDTQIFLIADQTKKATIPILFAIIAIFLLSYNDLNKFPLYIWLCIAIIATLMQTFLSAKIYNKKWFKTQKSRLLLVKSCSLCDSLIFLIPGVWSVYLNGFSFLAVIFILSSLCLGATLTTVGHKTSHLLYVGPIFISILFAFEFKSIETPSSGKIAFYIAVFGLFYFLLVLSKYVLDIFKKSYSIRIREKVANERLQIALEYSEKANKDKTRFLAAASHDLRQPINALSLFSSVLNMQTLEPELKIIAENIDIAIDALGHQLDALLDISKLDAGVIEADLEVFDLSTELQQIYIEFKPIADKQQVMLHLDNLDNAMVCSDKYLLARVLRNILSNAFKFTQEGYVKIELNAINTKLYEIKISDSGIGIPQDEQEKVFHEFYQIHNKERNREDGLGLGLSIVKRLATLLDLNIKMHSEVEQGTSYSISLPQVEVPVLTQEVSELTDEADPQSLNVLVVDDDKIVAYAMHTLLDSLGHKTRLADGTLSALDLVKDFKPDILLVDYRLRGDDNGLKVVKEVNALYPNTPAILITGDTGPQSLQAAKASSLTILHKPIKANILKEEMVKLVDTRRVSEAS